MPTITFSHNGKEVTCYRDTLNMLFVRDALGVSNELGCSWTVFHDGEKNVAVPDAHAVTWLAGRQGPVVVMDQ